MPFKDPATRDAWRERTKAQRRETFQAWETAHRAARNAYKRELRVKHPPTTTPEERAKANAYNRAWRAKNREKSRAYQAAWKAKHPERQTEDLNRLRVRAYGLTPEQFEAMRVAQGGRCAVCAEVPKGSFHVDHDHVTGVARGLLCGTCNRGLGMFHDSPTLLTKAAWYLERYAKSRHTA
jgi:hypothetical protein